MPKIINPTEFIELLDPRLLTTNRKLLASRLSEKAQGKLYNKVQDQVNSTMYDNVNHFIDSHDNKDKKQHALYSTTGK